MRKQCDIAVHSGMSFWAKFFIALLLISLTAVAVPFWYTRQVWSESMLKEAENQVMEEAKLAAVFLESQIKSLDNSPDNASATVQFSQIFPTKFHAASLRMTLLDVAGNVLADTQVGDAVKLDNHGDRPEVRQAGSEGAGLMVRYSNTLSYQTIYAAVRLEDNKILRVSVPFSALEKQQKNMQTLLIEEACAALLLSLLIAFFFAGLLRNSLDYVGEMVGAISRGKSPRRLTHVPCREFVPLAVAVNRMAENLEDQMLDMHEQAVQLEGVLESIEDGILVLDGGGRIFRTNRAMQGFFPLTARGTGKQVVESISSPEFQNAVDTLHSAENIQAFHLETPDGRILEVRLSPFASAGDADAPAAVAVFHDITEMLRVEQTRKDFVANVSHELRTPLTSIRGYAETLADMELPADATNFVQVIQRHGEYLAHMVEDLLTLRRLEQEQLSLHLGDVSPAECLESACGLCREALVTKDVDLQISLDSALHVRADSSLLIQVFRNILENACRYVPLHGIIRVEAAATCENGANMVTIQISDNGTGIPQADLSRVFERFYRVEKHRSASSGKSTGLGLSICKHILMRMGGRIWAKSPGENASTTFYIQLPAERS